MAAFPAYAKIIFDGFMQDPQPAVSRTDMEDGPPKQFKRRSRVMVERPVTVFLNSKTDFDNFHTWFKTDINRGASWFDWVDPYDSATKQARIKGGKISEKPRRKALDLWAVAMIIETWDS